MLRVQIRDVDVAGYGLYEAAMDRFAKFMTSDGNVVKSSIRRPTLHLYYSRFSRFPRFALPLISCYHEIFYNIVQKHYYMTRRLWLGHELKKRAYNTSQHEAPSVLVLGRD